MHKEFFKHLEKQFRTQTFAVQKEGNKKEKIESTKMPPTSHLSTYFATVRTHHCPFRSKHILNTQEPALYNVMHYLHK